MTTLRVYPQSAPLQGTITVPGDKSISHRAIMLAALADGHSVVRRWLPAGDTRATLGAMRSMGVDVRVDESSPQAWDLKIEGRGLHGLQPPAAALDCRNAGTCMRLLAGIMAGQRFPSTLDGSEQLRRRPMERIVDPLRAMGAAVESRDGQAPLHLRPASLRGISYEMPVASAQVKSAVLLAGLYARGETRVYQPGPARDHTERLLQAMGAPLVVDGNWISLRQSDDGDLRLAPLDLTVPGDISSAAFLFAAANVVPHSQLTIENVGLNPTRTGLLELLTSMGAQFTVENERQSAGEPAGDVTARFAELHGGDAAGDVVVRAIDEFPIWGVVASQAAGRSVLRDAAELRVKEVDRIGRLAGELRRMGVAIAERDDGFSVEGPIRLKGASVDSYGDHRLAMALAIAALTAAEPTTIGNAECIADSFPGFVQTMRRLGAQMEWI